MFPLNRTYKWPYSEPDRDYPPNFRYRETIPQDYPWTDMSIQGRRYNYRSYAQDDPTAFQYSSYIDVNGPPPNALNIRSYTLPHRRGAPRQEPIWIVPPKKEPRYVTMEVKEPDPEPIMILPPPPPKQKVIEYEVPVKQKDPEPIMVPMYPPPKEPEYITVRQVVEEPQTRNWQQPVPQPLPQPVSQHLSQRPGPVITSLPEDNVKTYYEDTLLGVRRTFLWELVLASFVLFIVMLLIAVFIAGFLS